LGEAGYRTEKPLVVSGFFCLRVLRASGEKARFFAVDACYKYLQKTLLTGSQFYSGSLFFCKTRAFPCGGFFDDFAHFPSAAGH